MKIQHLSKSLVTHAFGGLSQPLPQGLLLDDFSQNQLLLPAQMGKGQGRRKARKKGIESPVHQCPLCLPVSPVYSFCADLRSGVPFHLRPEKRTPVRRLLLLRPDGRWIRNPPWRPEFGGGGGKRGGGRDGESVTDNAPACHSRLTELIAI